MKQLEKILFTGFSHKNAKTITQCKRCNKYMTMNKIGICKYCQRLKRIFPKVFYK